MPILNVEQKYHHQEALKMRQFAPVHVGYDFECEKKNGKVYAGEIVKVAVYNGRTLVTIRFGQEESYFDRYNQRDITVTEPVYRSIYLEDCVVWYAGEPAPY
jgi:hypothetical protein